MFYQNDCHNSRALRFSYFPCPYKSRLEVRVNDVGGILITVLFVFFWHLGLNLLFERHLWFFSTFLIPTREIFHRVGDCYNDNVTTIFCVYVGKVSCNKEWF